MSGKSISVLPLLSGPTGGPAESSPKRLRRWALVRTDSPAEEKGREVDQGDLERRRPFSRGTSGSNPSF